MIADGYADIRAHQLALKPEVQNVVHVFGGDGKCVYCSVHRGSPAAEYHPECVNAPDSRTMNGHAFMNGRCTRCLAGFGSQLSRTRCQK